MIEKFDGVSSRFIAAPSVTEADLRFLAPQFVAAQLLATMRTVAFGEAALVPELDRELEVGASLTPGDPPLLSEATVTQWVSTLGMRRAAVRLLAIPLMYQEKRAKTHDVDYQGPYMNSEIQENWWRTAHEAVADPWPNDNHSSNTSMRPTRRVRASCNPCGSRACAVSYPWMVLAAVASSVFRALSHCLAASRGSTC